MGSTKSDQYVFQAIKLLKEIQGDVVGVAKLLKGVDANLVKIIKLLESLDKEE